MILNTLCKRRSKVMIAAVCISMCLVGCHKQSPVEQQMGFEAVEALDTQAQEETTTPETSSLNGEIHRLTGDNRHLSGNWSSTNGVFSPVSWEIITDEGKKLLVTVSNPRTVYSNQELNPNGFVDSTGGDSEGLVMIYNGELYQTAIDARSDRDLFSEIYPLWAQRYVYPEYIEADGSFMDPVCMVLIDVTVANPDGARNVQIHADGSESVRFGNPYVFTLGAIGGVLVDPTRPLEKDPSKYYDIYVGYYSNKSSVEARPDDGFLVKPGDAITFQLGFLLGNMPDGTEMDYSNFVFSSNSYLTGWYFSLDLK